MTERWYWIDGYGEEIPPNFGRMDRPTLLSDTGKCVLVYAEFDVSDSEDEVARRARLIAAAPRQAAEIERLKAENKKHESGHTLMTQVIMIANLEAENAKLIDAIRTLIPVIDDDAKWWAAARVALSSAIENAKETT